MNIRIETRRWKRLLRLFSEDGGRGIEELTLHLECAMNQQPDSEAGPLIRAWHDMCAVVAVVIETAGMAKENP